MLIKLKRMHRWVVANGKLHNFTINERCNSRISINRVEFDEDHVATRLAAANFQCEEMVTKNEARRSYNSEKMAIYMDSYNFIHPGSNQ
jgi:hypothetical protein